MFSWLERRQYKIPCGEGKMFIFSEREKGLFSLLEEEMFSWLEKKDIKIPRGKGEMFLLSESKIPRGEGKMFLFFREIEEYSPC